MADTATFGRLSQCTFCNGKSLHSLKNNGSRIALRSGMDVIRTALAGTVIDLAIKVHRTLGPGLFESVYQHCLQYELKRAGLNTETQVPLSLAYEELQIPCAFRADMIVERRLLIEVKSVEAIHPVHHAQVLTYLRLSGISQGVLFNFNVTRLKDGLKSFLMGVPSGEEESPRPPCPP